MDRIWLTKRQRIRRLGKGAMFSSFEYSVHDIWVDWPGADEIARELATISAEVIRRNIRNGVDANGAALEPDEDTLQRRRADTAPPRRSYRRLRVTAKGKARRAQRGNRYAERYPDGGSKGGSVPLSDSGHMADRIAVLFERSGRSAVAKVMVPKARIQAVLAIEKGQGVSRKDGRPWRTFGGVPHPIFAVTKKLVDDSAVSAWQKMMSCFAGPAESAASMLGAASSKAIAFVGAKAGVLGMFAAAKGLVGG